MATPPISSTHIPAPASRRERVLRRLNARAAWLMADTLAFGACAALFIHALA